MFELEIKRTFSAAHQLKGYDGKCQYLHGHNYDVAVRVRAARLNELGIAIDFTRLKGAVDRLLERYDHHNLSELPEFAAVNPTSEMLALTIYRALRAEIDDGNAAVHSVTVWESAGSSCTYTED